MGSKRTFSRRNILQAATASAVALGTTGVGLKLHNRELNPMAPPPGRIKDHRIMRERGSVEMAIARGRDAATIVRMAIEAMGGMAAFVRPGEKVLIKPNIGWNRLPEQAANTNPEVVAEIARMALAVGASKVWVCDVPVNNADQSFERSGIRKATGAAGGTIIMPESRNFRDVAVGGKLIRTAEVLFPFLEADRIINLPIAKQHSLSGATLSMKNWYGALGGHRVRLHQEIHRSIAELAAMVKPTLTILDATRVLLANGPSGGNLADVKQLDTVAVSTDEVALDAFGFELLGIARQESDYVAEAEKAKLGTSNYKSLKLVELNQ